VSENFFSLLGAKTSSGRPLERSDLANCVDCAVLSYDIWQQTNLNAMVAVGGRRYRVVGVLDKSFWFLSRAIGVWTIDSSLSSSARNRTGVVVRLRKDVSPRALSRELESILITSGEAEWESLVDVSDVGSSVHAVFGSFSFAVAIASIVVAASLRLRLSRWTTRPHFRGSAFFAVKTLLLLLAILLAGLEFTRAGSLTMLGGADITTEPLSTWLY